MGALQAVATLELLELIALLVDTLVARLELSTLDLLLELTDDDVFTLDDELTTLEAASDDEVAIEEDVFALDDTLLEVEAGVLDEDSLTLDELELVDDITDEAVLALLTVVELLDNATEC